MAKNLAKLIIEYSNKDDFRSQYEYIQENGLSNVDVFDDVISKHIYAAIHSDKESVDVLVDCDDWVWIKKENYEIMKKCIKHPKMLHKDDDNDEEDDDEEDYVLVDVKYVSAIIKLETQGFKYNFHNRYDHTDDTYNMWLHVDWSHWSDKNKDVSEESDE